MGLLTICGCGNVVLDPKAAAKAECLERVPDLDEEGFEDWYLTMRLARDGGQTLQEANQNSWIACTAVYPIQFANDCTACMNRIIDALY